MEYDYDPANPFRLTRIRSKDQVSVEVRYSSDTGQIESVNHGARTWKYFYTGEGRVKTLARVELPDGSDWTYTFLGVSERPNSIDEGNYGRLCNYNAGIFSTQTPGQEHVVQVKHPSGAVGQFGFRRIAHGSMHTPGTCGTMWSDSSIRTIVSGKPPAYLATTLVSKTFSGPGTPTQTWNYKYFPTWSSTGQWTGACDSGLPSSQADVVETLPDNTTITHTFGNSYCVNSGMLLGRVVRKGAVEFRRERIGYVTSASGQPFPDVWGEDRESYFENPLSRSARPVVSREITQDGVVFTWQALQFNKWAIPVEVTRSSSLGYSKGEFFSYRELPALWVLNQPVSRRDRELLTVEEVNFYVQSQINRIVKFGIPDYRRWYNLDGTLHQAISLDNGMVTLGDYYRGVPRSIVHSADNSQVSATVDTHGRVRSVTDALANTTNYEYDAQGRLTQTRFPTGDSTSWSNQDTAYQIRSFAEYGIPAGLWKRTQTRGRSEHVTWFDALWRPILTRERDINLPSSARFVRTAYDSRGNLSFESYPASLADGVAYTTLTQGVTRSYDALNRVTQERRSSELGDLISSTEYLSRFSVRNTNARGFQTTTSFMVYDEPTFDWPVNISEPERKSTEIQRDRWGKPTRITRQGWYVTPTGSWEPSAALRSFVYDANQRLCKRIDSESGATVMDYDAANRLAWTADGQNLPSTSSCDRESVAANQRVLRSYNTKDELTAINYPDSTDDVAFAYYLDGKLQTANVGPVGSQISRSYSYNKRGLPTQEQLLVDGQSFALGYRYTSEGAASELGYPDGSWEALNPDGLGRPTRMGQFASNVSWHSFGPLAGFTYGNGASFSQQLNARGLPSERSDSWFGTQRLRDSYAWDGNGNLGSISDLVGDPSQFRSASRWLTYDGLDRLTVADSPSQTTTRSQWGYSWGKATYAYDGLDNLRRHTMGGVIDFAYSYGSQGHLNSITQPSGASVSSYTHNARGQMTRRMFAGEGFNLSWDSGHRVTQTWNDASTKVESYRYDAHGHRARTVRGGETLYQVYSQAGDLMWERSSTGTTRKYARLGGRLIGEIENGVRRAIHTDALGSVRQKTDQFGTVLLDDVRAPYGSTLLGGSYRNGPAFTGHMEDGATGLTYMKARYYDPVAMRFISPDPVYVDLNTGGNFNRYWYANNNPYSYTDPDGRFVQALWGAPIGAIVDIAAQKIANPDKSVNWTSVAVSAGVGAVTGGIASIARTAAVNGTVTVGQAVVATAGANAVVGAAGSAVDSVANGETPSMEKMAISAVANGGMSLAAGLGGTSGMLAEKMSAAAPMSPQRIGNHIAATTQSISGNTAALQGAASVTGRVVDVARQAGASSAQKKLEEEVQ